MPRVFYWIAGLCGALAVATALAALAYGFAYLMLALGLLLSAPLWAAIGRVLELLQDIRDNTAPVLRPPSQTGGTAPNPARRSIFEI